MQIILNSETGKTISLKTHNHETVGDTKHRISQISNNLDKNFDPNKQSLYFNNKIILNTKNLSDYSIKHNSTLNLSLEVIGDPKLEDTSNLGDQIINEDIDTLYCTEDSPRF